MQKTMMKVAVLTVTFLFFHVSNAKAQNDFNLNAMTASDIEFSDELNQKGIFDWIKKPKPEPLDAKEWTVMVFMNAKNDLSEKKFLGLTGKFSQKDIAEMKKVGTTDKVNVVVEYGAAGKKTKRMLIKKKNGFFSKDEVVYEKFKNADMGDYKEVVDFVKWSKTNFPAKKYMLVLWNHGLGWLDPNLDNHTGGTGTSKGILFDDETKNYVKTLELGEIFKETGYIDILMMNACLMQMAEIAYEVKDNIGLLIGSEETMLAQGFDYKRLLNFMNADTSFSDREISDFLMSWYREFYNEGMELGPITVPLDAVGATLSTIRPQALNNLPYHLDRFASAAMRNNDTDAVKYAIEHVIRFTSIDAKDKEKMLSSYVDLYNFTKLVTVKLIVDKPSSHDTIQAAEDLMNFINTELVIRKVGINGDETNGYDYSNVGGIAIEMTRKNKKTLAIDLSSLFTTKYSDLSLSKASLWDEFLTWTDEVWAQ